MYYVMEIEQRLFNRLGTTTMEQPPKFRDFEFLILVQCNFSLRLIVITE